MTFTILALLGALMGCQGETDPRALMEMSCDNCGAADADDPLAGCDSCFKMANAAINSPRPNVDQARDLFNKACQVHHPPSCMKLGELVRDGRGGPRDMKRASKLFEIACEKGDIQPACVEVGIASYDGVGRKKDQAAGVALFTSACEHPEAPQPKACTALGLAYLSGEGVEDEKKDEDKAIELLNKACDFDYPPGCVQVGDLFAERKKGPVKENQATAAAAYERACKLDPRHGCFEIAMMHQEGKIEEASDEKAAIFFQKTCNIDPTRGCYEAAELMSSGKVTAREGEVESLYNIACEHGQADACAKRSMGE